MFVTCTFLPFTGWQQKIKKMEIGNMEVSRMDRAKVSICRKVQAKKEH